MKPTLPLSLLLSIHLLACRGDAPPDHAAEREPHAEPADHADHADHGAHADEAPGVVRIAPAALERNQIRVAEVALEPFTGGLELPAEIHLLPDRVAHVSSLVSGQIVAARASVGDRVAQGAVLATLRSVELGQARSELARASAASDSARANYARQQTLEQEGIGAQRALQEARAAFEQAEAEKAAAKGRLGVYGAGAAPGSTVALRAPIAGTVIERHATPGEITRPEEPLFVVADTARVWVLGRAYEQDVGRVIPGAAVTVRLAAYPGRSWSGRIDHVATVLDETTRTLPVRVELDNPDGLLRPGLFGSMTLATDPSAPVLPVVPDDAVQRVADRDVVFVPGDEPGEFRVVAVRVAGRALGRATIEDGLAAGARVVVSGAFVLKSELLRDEMGEGHAH